MELTEKIIKELIEIRNRAYPNESAAFLFNNNSVVVEAHPKDKSEVHFGEIDPLWVNNLITTYGFPSALFHSHPCEAFISGTDLRFMRITSIFWNNCPWIVMSDRKKIKAWILEDNTPKEIKVNINE